MQGHHHPSHSRSSSSSSPSPVSPSSGPSSAPHIEYTIRYGNTILTRRYSEFAALREALVRLHPACIVPPVPEKHTLVEMAEVRARGREDWMLVERRKRQLSTFLRRLARHPILATEHVLHRFLEPDVPWITIISEEPLASLPKLSKGQRMPLVSHSQGILAPSLPAIAGTPQPKHPDPRFRGEEEEAERFHKALRDSVEAPHRRVSRKLGDMAQTNAELGAIYNGFSLSEGNGAGLALERVGQAVDASFISGQSLTTALEIGVGEVLGEYGRFWASVTESLGWRRSRHVRVEMLAAALERKRAVLTELEGGNFGEEEEEEEEGKEEEEARGSSESEVTHDPELSTKSHDIIRTSSSPPASPSVSLSPSPIIPSSGDVFQGMLDVDPEATRRDHVGRTRNEMILLERELEEASDQLDRANAAVLQELDRYHRVRARDLRQWMLAYSKIHATWCHKNLKMWEEAREEVERVESFP
ncbi:MAG: hypothetical protein DHS80DRAFT_19753 [Piptocephalis tieghemiana]|nr:MAG: hypothetical protein DHS80DRAFT_19753 [Piptocephalis tieghemiana]